MKKLMVFMLVMMFSVSAYAGQGRVHRVFNAVPIIGTADGTDSNTYSTVYSVASSGYFGAWIDLDTGIGTPDIDISCQMSYDDTAANFATPTSMSLLLDGSTSILPQVVSFAPSPMKYMRFFVSGESANTTGTTITMYMFSQD